MAILSTTAWAAHNLGIAADFGGSLFGQIALEPAVAVLDDKRERGEVTHEAWNRYKFVNGLGLFTMGAGWLIGRVLLSGREVGKHARRLTLVKDALVGGAVVAGIATIGTGMLLDKASGGPPPVETGATPAAETPPNVARLQRMVNLFGNTKLVLEAGIMVVTTVLAMKAGRSARWAFASRFLP